ncbi:CocE/NonD family hydrolase, partial [Pseudonocardia sp. KRD291]|uniref:CocE/NonD family hydrolase n=1 Tax=Pseudonocardia sp. KRD291 TaxID=2792007 RepID=UPI001C4A2514
EPVRYHVGGENRWASAASWPPPGRGTAWLLGSGGDARSASGDGSLHPATGVTQGPGAQGPGAASDTVRADPHDPFPTCGGAFPAAALGPDGIQDQRAVDHRADVLVYTSPTLAEPVSVAGVPRLELALSSTAPDADVCVTLVDVEPDGFALPVAEGAVRTRYRLGGTADWLAPGEPVTVQVALHDTAHTFRAGHRIRVHVAGACYPRRSRNLHTRTVPELGTAGEAVVAEHTVHHDPSQPSRLVLPEVGAR